VKIYYEPAINPTSDMC